MKFIYFIAVCCVRFEAIWASFAVLSSPSLKKTKCLDALISRKTSPDWLQNDTGAQNIQHRQVYAISFLHIELR